MVIRTARQIRWSIWLLFCLLMLTTPAAAQDDGPAPPGPQDAPAPMQENTTVSGALPIPAAPAGQAPGATMAQEPREPAAGLKTPDRRPRLLLSPAKLARLRELAEFNTYRWRRLLTWAMEPSRQGAEPHDGPGLALAAIMLAKERPQQAARLLRLAARCAINGARYGVVEKIAQGAIVDNVRLGDTTELLEQGYHAVAPDAARDLVLTVGRLTPTRLIPETGNLERDKLTAKGRMYLLLKDDLAKAAVTGQAVALTLDWAWDAFQPAEREAVAAWLVVQAGMFKDRGRGCFDSESAAALKLAGLAGLAAWGVDPRAEALARDAYENRYRKAVEPCLANAGQGGGWFEGTSAGSVAGMDLLVYALCMDTASGVRIAPDNPWYNGRLAFLIFGQLPGVNTYLRGAYRSYFTSGDPVVEPAAMGDLMRLQMAACLNLNPGDPLGGVARALLLDRRTPSVSNSQLLVYEFLWLDPSGDTAPLATAPLVHAAPGLGWALMRSDWSDRATWLGFSCGPHYAMRQHLDLAGIQIHRMGPLLDRGGAWDGPDTSHALNYAIRSVGHNTLLVYDPKEYSWYDMRMGPQPKGAYANDGGSRVWAAFDDAGKPTKQAPWTASGWDTGGAPFAANRDLYQVGTLEATEDQPRYAYARGDATAGYRGSTAKVERLKRHVFLLRGSGPDDAQSQEVVAVVDDVSLARPELEVRFTMHLASKPETTSELSRLGPGRWRGPGDRLSVADRHSRLTAVCLWPASPVLDLYGVEGEAASWAGERNWPPRGREKNPAPWRVDFWAPATESKERPMVMALLPADPDAPGPVRLEALTAGRPDVVGMVIHDPGWPRALAVRLGKPDDTLITYSYPPGRCRHLVAGLLPQTEYAVEVGPQTISLRPGTGLKTSAGGLLAFKVAPETGAYALPERP